VSTLITPSAVESRRDNPMTDVNLKTKHTLYIIRHGVAVHNIPMMDPNGHYIRPNLSDTRFFDAPLVAQGKRESHEAGVYLKQLLLDSKIDGVICSPLTRCLQTAHEIVSEIGFKGTWQGREELREAFGIYQSDKRRTKSELERTWHNVHFDMTEEDECWKPNRRESLHDIEERIDYFLFWLSKNHKQCIGYPEGSSPKLLIVSHGVWMECLFRKYFPSVLEGGKRVYNCDIYKADVTGFWSGTNENLTYMNSAIDSVSFLYSAHKSQV
jgi:broad specificity phosphatase PhoE